MTRVLEVMAMSSGGIGRHVAAVVGALDAPDLSLDIAAPPSIATPMPKAVLPLEIPHASNFAAGKGSRRALRALVEEGRYDVVHAHGLRASVTALGGSGGKPVVITLHNLIRPETSGRLRSILYRRAETAAVRKADRVFAVSAEMATVLTQRIPSRADRIELLPIGLGAPIVTRSAADVRHELDVGERRLVLTVARLARQKALDVLLKAMTEVPDAVLAIVGDGRLESELRELASSLEIDDRVRFVGWREQVGDYLRAADVFALSSTWEARALAVQEAILAELPVVSTDVGGMPELITDRHSGLLVPPNEPKLMAAAINELLDSPDVAKAYARRAKAELTEGYSDAAMLDRVRSVYLELAGA